MGAQTGVEPEEERGVETDEAREADRVVGGGEEFVAVDRAETEAPLRVEIVAVPEREGVARKLGETGAGDDGGGLGRLDRAVLIRVAADNAPVAGDATGETELDPARALTVDEERSGRISGIGDGDVAAVETVGGGSEGEVVVEIPLHAKFVIREFFRSEGAVGEAQGGELFAGAGHAGCAVTRVDREVSGGFVDEAGAG